MKKLIVSDIHLRSEDCNAKGLLDLLKASSYEELIIVGDLFEKEGRINDEQFEVITYLWKHR